MQADARRNWKAPSITPPIERAAAALRRVTPAARWFGRLCRVIGLVGAAGSVALWLLVAARRLGHWPGGTAVAVATAVMLALAPWWLWHAASTLHDLARLPDRLGTPSRPERGDRARVSARTLRRTVAEVADYLAPGLAVVEVASPTFWVWTGAAVVAVAITVVLVPVAGLVVLLGGSRS